MLLRNLLVLITLSWTSSQAQFMIQMGNQFMDVFETPFIHAGKSTAHFSRLGSLLKPTRLENIVFDVDTRVYEVDSYNQIDDNLKQLEQMVIRDDEKFAQNIVSHHPNQSTADLQPESHQEVIEMTDQFKNLDDSFIFIEFDQRFIIILLANSNIYICNLDV